MTGDQSDPHVPEIMERALQLAEDTLEQIMRITVEQIRRGTEASNHIDAAERDMRSALRQLVMAQREWEAKSRRRATSDETARVTVDLTSNSSL
jgi:hypothetical protein